METEYYGRTKYCYNCGNYDATEHCIVDKKHHHPLDGCSEYISRKEKENAEKIQGKKEKNL